MQTLKIGNLDLQNQLTYLAFLIWNIWKERNNSVFRDKKPSPICNNGNNNDGFNRLPRQWFSEENPSSLPLIAEALALREAIQLAHDLQWLKCLFESDNIQVVKACRGEVNIGEIEAIIRDITHKKPSFALCGFLWVNRKGNESSNLVARACLNGSLPTSWLVRPHPPLKNLLLKEACTPIAS
ncbi:Ribonuclease H-like superfamily [Sesbania bispinosa]|nr:Ribonuclease H-like superfamily [Sesbania bispinosa]